MFRKKSFFAAAALFFLTIGATPQAQSNMYYALSTGMYYPALPAEGYSSEYNSTMYERPAKLAIAENITFDGETRATAVMLDTRTEFPVYERRHYKRLAVEEPVYELKTDPTPPVSSVNKVMVAPHGYLTYQREFTENYVMPDFRKDVWLEKPYLIGSRMQIIKDKSISHKYTSDDSEDE